MCLRHVGYRRAMKQPSERSTVKRLPERGTYDQDTINQILDEALICHLAFVTDRGPVVIPTIHARIGRVLYFHGSHASRMLRTTPGEQVSIAATIVDGIVAARSAFHHSLNYRSVVVFGTPRVVTDKAERRAAFEAITNHVLPGRWDEARHPSDKEDAGTKLLAVDLDEASAKVRSGPPVDDEEDMALGIWAGVIPLSVTPGVPEPAPDVDPGIDIPPSVRRRTLG
ncbi:MAG: pyridoxamine 5'-phosphate oxidase family protein [Acidimicrobiia bacterium]|nr:MAG: pyridoxamine 5'-phosphate oxidase family protein [Acidimicrobiia bacterium]